MYIVYSTTKSPLPYPNVLIVDGDPALAVNDPERLVVIPMFALTPVNPEPSPENEVAVTIPVTITPGVPSFAAAAAALGTELTLPGLAQSVVLTRTPGRASAMPDTETLRNFARTKATLAIHLSVHNLAQVVETLTPVYGEACPAAIVYRASWPDQQIIRGQLNTLNASLPEDIERTALILVGPALGGDGFEDSCLYAPDYDRRFRSQIARQRGKV